MVSDLDLVTRLREILRISDLDTATPASVRRQLEEDFSVDLTDKKGFIRDQIDAILKSNAGIEDIPESPRTEERIAMDGIVRIAIEGAVGRHPVKDLFSSITVLYLHLYTYVKRGYIWMLAVPTDRLSNPDIREDDDFMLGFLSCTCGSVVKFSVKFGTGFVEIVA
ncbi:unnamed protein product [Arabis nemorensis]|uniref:DEK-C domain-containing protein n=1 Tax=Arabis nemorensis TaxID=586526 RepID=A0A565CI45_9BRAS|nr:unnamed protein product [Arabis nemorensis]